MPWSRLRGQPYPIFLGALHVPVPRGKDAHSSLTSADICSVAGRCSCHRSDSCRPAASASCTGSTACCSFSVAPPPLSLSPSFSPKNSRIPLSTRHYQQQEHRDRRLMLPTRSPPRVLLPPVRSLFPALLARCTHATHLFLSIGPVHTEPDTLGITSNAIYPYARALLRVCKKTWQKRISDASRADGV